jgi:Ras-related protein Rab-5C
MFTYKPTKTFKLVLVGDVSVGKTCLLKRFIKNNFCYIHEPTIGSEFSEYFLHNDDNIIKLLIWDTCGEERFRAIAPIYYRDADAAVVVLLFYFIDFLIV